MENNQAIVTDFERSVARMNARLLIIRGHAQRAMEKLDEPNNGTVERWEVLTEALGNIAHEVRDTLTMQTYWLGRLVEDGVIRPAGVCQ